MSDVELLKERIARQDYTVGVIGLGYVGLPLVLRFGEVGFRVIGFDIDAAKIEQLNDGASYIQHVPGARVQALLDARRFEATADLERLAEPDAIIICVPTPLTQHREPDLRYVEKTADAVAAALRRDQLVCLESTTYPGTTDEVVLPRLEAARPARRRGLLPGLLARARGSRQRAVRHRHHPQGRRRRHAGLPGAGHGAVRARPSSRSCRSPPRGWPRRPRSSRTSTAP